MLDTMQTADDKSATVYVTNANLMQDTPEIVASWNTTILY